MEREINNGIADTQAYRLDPSHPSGKGPGMSAKLRRRIRAAAAAASMLAMTGCAPKGCRRESGMFGVFGSKYWSGYICRPIENNK